jgi:hypothetical protein
MRRTVFSRIALALSSAAVFLAGCGERQVEVKGRVTYNGTPLKKDGGQVVFVGPKGTQVVAPIGPDGAYLAAGVPVGANRVAVYYPNPQAASGRRFPVRPQKDRPAPPAVPTPPAPAFVTPSKYASVESSGLSVDVKDGAVFDAALVGPKLR